MPPAAEAASGVVAALQPPWRTAAQLVCDRVLMWKLKQKGSSRVQSRDESQGERELVPMSCQDLSN
eukprot:CAMPEP_0172156002 /NCGR_PEP_ID=MMETSP1050-20130122/2946_1 /TAXON_ID=233186 /ORGANISM="Cryptomonas curvata, Strain CCAP979/52" /LENGTH=65 /DNA_ID=CAMNT_0012824977 /DNA_START=78 /DNA_END=275 /DNA_ORIENTATION=+